MPDLLPTTNTDTVSSTDRTALGSQPDNSTPTGTISAGGGGTVTSVSVVTSNGVSGSVATATTTPAITLTLGAIVPTSVNNVVISGTSTPKLTVTGTSSISGANTGDQTIPTSLPPSGAAGGDLSGMYPNPNVAKINGVALSGLATGILKNTTTSGVPSIAVATDFPTLNQDTTGTAANVTGTVAIANGGTGQTTQQAAINALAGAVTSAQFLRGNGTNVVMSAIQASDVPTLNQSTTGNAATASAVAVSGITGLGTNVSTFLATPSSSNLAAAVTDETGSGSLVFATSPALVTPNLGTPSAAVLTNATSLPLSTGVTGTLPVANGGTGAGTLTGYVKGNGTAAMTASASISGSDVSGNITGNADNVTGVVAIANGGTGQNTASNAINALLPAQTGNSGKFLTTNGTDPSWGSVSGALPTGGAKYARLAKNSTTNYDVGWYGPDVFNVKDYGAAGTGGDDHVAINAAIAAINSSTYGGCLYFPAGTYGMGSTAFTAITKPVKISGDGAGVTIISLAASLDGFSIDYSSASGAQFASCYDLTIKTANSATGNTALTFKQKTGGTTKPSFEFSALSIEGCWSKGIYVNNAALNDSQGGTIRDIGLVGTQGTGTRFGYGIYLAGASNINVSGVKLTEGDVGCYVASSPACEGVWVSDCIFVNVRIGVDAEGANTWMTNVHCNVSQVYTASSAGSGFYVRGNQSILTSCYILTDKTTTVGYDINATEVNMTNCLALRTSSTMTNGVLMGSSCAQCVISNNHFQAISGAAISCSGHNNLIEGNYYTDCSATYPINDTGTNNVCINNFSSNSAGIDLLSSSSCPIGYKASATWDPASLVSGQQDFLNISVAGAAFGQAWVVGVPYDLQNMIAIASVYSSGTVRVTLYNSSGSTVNLGSGTWTVTRLS